MLLEITRNADKPHIISYTRDDGTKTWMYADDFFVRHDLSHYAIEKKLGYTSAFMGMLNNGMDIKDFEDREKRTKMIISKEARFSEHMANLFLMEANQGQFDDFNDTVKGIFRSVNEQYDPPVLSSNELAAVRVYLRELCQAWDELPVRNTMSLSINF